MRTLITGITGSIGAVLAPALKAEGYEVRGFSRDPARVTADVDAVVEGDAISGRGVDEALDGVDVAYYLIHSMETGADDGFDLAERRAAENFAEAARRAGTRRIVYLGGLVPEGGRLSRHLGSRLAVERTLLEAVPSSIAFRASIVISAESRSFRFLVRLVERLPVMALPAWRKHRTRPIDGRDVTRFLTSAATCPEALGGRAWDIGGPDVLTYGEMIDRITDHLLVARPRFGLGFSLTSVAAPVAAAVAGEEVALIGPLMESLETDLLPRDDRAADAFGVRLHPFDAAVERSLRDLEEREGVRAR